MNKAMQQTPNRPRAVSIAAPQELLVEAETPFVEGSNDQLDPDLRHRLVSERAYARYCERGYADGYDVDDWFEAEAEVDHIIIPPRGAPQ